MKPVSHPSNTRTLGAPAGWDQSGLPVEPLGVTDTEMNGVPCVTSFWQPDAEELAHLQAGALVGLSIVGRTMPPAAVVTFVASVAPHADDLAVDRFAAAMKEKLAAARAKARGGWEQLDLTREALSVMLCEHVEKGDPRDVANFCMFLHQRGEDIAAPAPVAPTPEPFLWVSPEQAAAHTNPDPDTEPTAGRYLPCRKTPAGKFTQPLYAALSPTSLHRKCEDGCNGCEACIDDGLTDAEEQGS